MPTLFSADEAKTAFAESACTLAIEVDASRMAIGRFLARRGSLANLSTKDRHAVADLWALTDTLRESGSLPSEALLHGKIYVGGSARHVPFGGPWGYREIVDSAPDILGWKGKRIFGFPPGNGSAILTR